MVARAPWLALLAVGCTLDLSTRDADEDGYAALLDCDDSDPAVQPGAPEHCDGRDENCDGAVDEDAQDARPYYEDVDGDGFGGTFAAGWACAVPAGYAGNGDDCDDGDAQVHPGAMEVCDTIDQDCDGAVADSPASLQDPWYADADGDGFGDPAVWIPSCDASALGYVHNADDCDDVSPWAAGAFPGAAEEESAVACMQDGDGDGWGDAAPVLPAVVPGRDCNDTGAKAPYTFPGSAEHEGPQDCTLDEDGDGWGAEQPAVAAVVPGLDCSDDGPYDRWTFPGAAPQDLGTACMQDRDGDDFGEARPADPRVTAGTDCDDGDAGICPDSLEVCDGVDQDCDGAVDEGLTVTVHPDADRDGYGDAAIEQQACGPTSTLLLDASDCDDTDPTVHPGATEWCDGRDEDCDGEVDDAVTWIETYPDADGDGWGVDVAPVSDCLLRSGFAAVPGDCDDTAARTHPGATEIPCDGNDQDCDGAAEDCVTLDAHLAWGGESTSDEAGFAVAGAGDVDGDGHPDLLIGAPGWSHASLSRGAAYLVLGGPVLAGRSLAGADQRILGPVADAYAGAAVAGVGDVDGDGLDDVLIGAYFASPYALRGGAVGLFFGSATPTDTDMSAADATWGGSGSGDYAGRAVAGAGDVDGDGLADMLVGALLDDRGGTDAGVAYLVLGTAHPVDGTLGWVGVGYLGAVAGDHAGGSVAGAGDVDGDGLDDVLVGASAASPDATSQGMAYLVLGSATPSDSSLADADAAYVGLAGDYAGLSVAVTGDVDGDGLDDLLIGAHCSSTAASRAGAAYLVLGAALPTDRDLALADATFLGEASLDLAGYAVAGAGDVDADGFADLLIGAPYSNLAWSDAGVAYLVRGGAGLAGGSLALADLTLAGVGSYDTGGWALAGAGDVDADGLDDFLVGAPLATTSSRDEGAAYLVLGGELW